jgi:hypothetical protein
MGHHIIVSRRELILLSGLAGAAAAVPGLLAKRTASATSTPRELTSYPLRVSRDHRFLVDRKQVPFLIAGDAPQALIVKLSEREASDYYLNRVKYGFNSLWINLVCAAPYFPTCRKDGATYDGIRPFTNFLSGARNLAHYDLTRPNGAYFDRADRMLNMAATSGFAVFLDPIETGQWLDTLRNNGRKRCFEYGRFIARRYHRYRNIIWLNGNDFGSWSNPADDAVVQAVAEGIQSVDPSSLQTVELLSTPSLKDPSWGKIISLNAAYTYHPTYRQMLENYNHTPTMPTFLLEAHYELENVGTPADFGTPEVVRRQAYWTMLCGGAGQMYGNHFIWGFFPGWKAHLNTAGAAQFKIWKEFFTRLPWYSLVPDQDHKIITAGYGHLGTVKTAVSNSDYCTAAATPDRHLVLAYLPTRRAVQVDASRVGGAVQVRWFDPTSGRLVMGHGTSAATGGRIWCSPPGRNSAGAGDWVLMVTANKSHILHGFSSPQRDR